VVDIDGGIGIYEFAMALADLCLFGLFFAFFLSLSHVCADYFLLRSTPRHVCVRKVA
jgi:hypothetical protein